MTPKANSPSDRSKKNKPAPTSPRGSSASPKQAAKRPADVVVPIMASDERRGAPLKEPADLVRPKQGKGAAHRKSATEQRLDHIPGESGPEVQPYLDSVEPRGAMNKSTVHQTESKVNHPMGKTRSGVAQRRGR